jgi:hypothetical protein
MLTKINHRSLTVPGKGIKCAPAPEPIHGHTSYGETGGFRFPSWMSRVRSPSPAPQNRVFTLDAYQLLSTILSNMKIQNDVSFSERTGRGKRHRSVQPQELCAGSIFSQPGWSLGFPRQGKPNKVSTSISSQMGAGWNFCVTQHRSRGCVGGEPPVIGR